MTSGLPDVPAQVHLQQRQNRDIYTIRAVMLMYMSEVSKVHTGLSIQSYVTHVEGVKSSSIYTIRVVMLCMSKVLKVAQYTL